MSFQNPLIHRIVVTSMIVLTIASAAVAQTPQYPVGGPIPEPKKLKHVEPVYPEAARTAGVARDVILDLVIGTDGSVTDAKLLRRPVVLDARIGPDGKVVETTIISMAASFEQAALEAVRQWRYTPTVLSGQPVEVLMTVTVRFALKSDQNPAQRIRAGSIVPEPKVLKRVEPVYPPAAVAAGASGTVLLDIGIGKDGSVLDAKVMRSVPMFEAAAVEAVRQWKYTPSLLNGEPVEVQLIVAIVFGIKSPRD